MIYNMQDQQTSSPLINMQRQAILSALKNEQEEPQDKSNTPLGQIFKKKPQLGGYGSTLQGSTAISDTPQTGSINLGNVG